MLTVTPNARCQKDDGSWKPSLKGRFDFLYSNEEDLVQNLLWKSVKSG